ncbi:uncharacterized protein [Physeter macrocephalus]|uniref:Uncharacterized protein n=1 Tax=Physeter macrocephalus TaxID=9755 RepID=A0A455AZZ7_PHYMC|nr:uncharacterized protein LOC114485276 [Physeter catodon]|eukprot:XP_028342230.1 uncharacterized protein LOC114485276 [Physeter catodon]
MVLEPPGSLSFTAQTQSWIGGNRPDSLRPLPALWAAPSSLLQLRRAAALVLCHFRHPEPPAAEPVATAASSLCARAPSLGANPRPQRPSAERTEPAKACGRLGTRQRRRAARGWARGRSGRTAFGPHYLQAEKLGGGAQSALILSRICEGGSRRGHEHPQSAPGQGSIEGRGGATRERPRLLQAQPDQPPAPPTLKTPRNQTDNAAHRRGSDSRLSFHVNGETYPTQMRGPRDASLRCTQAPASGPQGQHSSAADKLPLPPPAAPPTPHHCRRPGQSPAR